MESYGPLLLIVAVFVIFVLPIIVMYNGLVTTRNHCREAWSDVETELKRRYDLIPNLVATVKGYAEHERELLAEVTRLRGACMANHGSPEQQAATENELSGVLRRLLAVVEAYPELKADAHFLALQRELTNTEDRIQAARRFYNGNVRDLANRIQMFPSSLVAGAFGFTMEEYFKLDAVTEAQSPEVSLSE